MPCGRAWARPTPLNAEADRQSGAVADLRAGERELRDEYSGDGNPGPSEATSQQTIGRVITRTRLISSPVTGAPHPMVTFEAAVDADAPGTPTGSLTFRDGTTVLARRSSTPPALPASRSSSVREARRSPPFTKAMLSSVQVWRSRPAIARPSAQPGKEQEHVTESTYTVTGMTCDHCVRSVKAELEKLPGVMAVDVDLGTHVRLAREQPIDEAAVEAAVEEAGYDLAS